MLDYCISYVYYSDRNELGKDIREAGEPGLGDPVIRGSGTKICQRLEIYGYGKRRTSL